jgi:hypothetical protein
MNLKQMFIKFKKHMEDFFSIWVKYNSSFPASKHIGKIKNINDKFADIIPNYSVLKNELLILNIRASLITVAATLNYKYL